MTSLSLPGFSLTRCRHQLQSTSFDKSSFEHRALPCAALLSESHSQQLQMLQFQNFQLTRVQLSQHTTQGGVHLRAFSKIASTSRASTLISLSFAQDAWLKTSRRKALRSRPLRQRSLSRSGPATAWPATTSTTTSKTATKNLRRTLLQMLWFSFFVNIIFIGSSFWRKELVEHNELLQTVQSFPLGHLHDHLGKEQQDQLQQNLSREKIENNKLDHNQLRENKVPDRELSQLHLQQLCLQDPASAIRRQLLKETLSSKCLSDRSLDPAASLSETLSFSKKKLSAQDLPDNSFDKFFPENFGQQISEKQLQQNLSTDQPQLQNRNLAQTAFQHLRLEQPNFTEKILHKELATNLDKKSLEENLSFQNFFFDNLAFQTTASGEVAKNNFYQKQLEQSSFTQTGEEACKEQLQPPSLTAAGDNRQLSSSLVQQSEAKAASQPELSPAYSQGASGRKTLQTGELAEEQLADRTLRRRPLQRTACKEDLLQHQLLQETAFQEKPFPGQLFSQQLARTELQNSNFSDSSFEQRTFR